MQFWKDLSFFNVLKFRGSYENKQYEQNNLLKMSATSRSYTQNFLKVQCIIIQAILSRKSMKKFIVTDEKIFRVNLLVDFY